MTLGTMMVVAVVVVSLVAVWWQIQRRIKRADAAIDATLGRHQQQTDELNDLLHEMYPQKPIVHPDQWPTWRCKFCGYSEWVGAGVRTPDDMTTDDIERARKRRKDHEAQCPSNPAGPGHPLHGHVRPVNAQARVTEGHVKRSGTNPPPATRKPQHFTPPWQGGDSTSDLMNPLNPLSPLNPASPLSVTSPAYDPPCAEAPSSSSTFDSPSCDPGGGGGGSFD